MQLGIEPPKFSGFVLKEIQQVAKKQEMVDGKLYEVFQKQYLLLPTKDGEKL